MKNLQGVVDKLTVILELVEKGAGQFPKSIRSRAVSSLRVGLKAAIATAKRYKITKDNDVLSWKVATDVDVLREDGFIPPGSSMPVTCHKVSKPEAFDMKITLGMRQVAAVLQETVPITHKNIVLQRRTNMDGRRETTHAYWARIVRDPKALKAISSEV